MLATPTLAILALLAAVVLAAPPVPLESDSRITPAVHNVFVSQNQDDVQLRFIQNSGVCETTPGVQQMSGYVDIGTDMSMWFWFFEARENPETAPFTLWLNGGPGCSSMIGMFQENGPCQVNSDGKTTVLNPFSWNNISNVIYIDQPIGTGFSFGTVNVNSTFNAAPPIWQAFQILFESPQFNKFQSREFIFATESYGGHYGPEFVTFFDQQNTLIDQGKLQGEKIEVSALMINNGWFDPLLQNKAYVDFATNAPGYGQLQSDAVLAQMNEDFNKTGGCRDMEMACFAAGTESANSDKICRAADNFCVQNIFSPAVGNRDSDDLRQSANSQNPFPPEFYLTFLRNQTVLSKIGAQAKFSECANAPFSQFSKTGDDARTLLPQLSALANSGLKLLIWAGDADINCNWLGGHAVALAMDWFGNETLHNTPFTNMTINGKAVAAVKNVENFTFARVFAAGHEVPAFQPEAAFEIFSQILRKEQLHSV
ncbi:alpha/beta-hydrolase [Cristinia sonorae]|uniref:Alpha/beta-hydrolase n=1 Tax=Cristinia sonorae TaxID=1940300 RepID=A0A8K0XSN5_9AGAR|nr:alpha/beta-hydrolase [Cristinia sonorae]